MHDPLTKFIADARAKGFSDDQIATMLYEHGWPKQPVEVALIGLKVPDAPAETNHQKSDFGRTISSLEAALQHILLWVFTATSTVMFGLVAALLFANEEAPKDLVTIYFVIELLTFIPFAIMFGHYLREFRKHTDLKTGKIWSTITIVLHSIGLMSALITLILGWLLIDGSDTKTATVIGGASLALINGFVVGAYVTINYTKNFTDKLRNMFIVLFPVALLVITIVFGLYSLAQFAPINHDKKMRSSMSKNVSAVRKYTKVNKALPADLKIEGAKDANLITYVPISKSQYKLCATFRTDTEESYYDSDDVIYDSYISDYEFMGVKKGNRCFIIQSEDIEPRRY